ncbi:unnamed protein product [Sphagnum balticum]
MLTFFSPHSNLQRVFHKDMGCMTGILQIFDRHPALTAQRYSSRCNPNLHGLSPNFLYEEVVKHVQTTITTTTTKPRLSFYIQENVTPPPPPPLPSSSFQGRDGGHPFAVEGCKDVLAREAAVTAASSPGYSGNRSDNVGQKSSSFSVRGGGDHQENNVVARLMGLDKLPNFDQQKKTPPQKSLFCRTPPREMMQERRDRHVCEAQIMQERKDRHACEAHHEVRSRSASCQSPKFMEGMPPLLFKQQDAFNNNAMKSGNVPHTGKQFLEENAAAVQKLDFVTRQEPLSGDMAQRVRQLRLRNSVQERKTLKQILEAMQLKGLLHSPNHKQVQGLNSRSDPTMPPTESYLQPHCQESNNQQTPISSKLTISILNNEDYHQAKHEHQETPRLLGSHEYYLANSNTRTHEEMITQGDEVEPQKIELVSLLETDSQTVSVSKKRNDHRSSIVTMKPIKTKVGSLLQAPKVMSPPTSTPGAEIGATMEQPSPVSVLNNTAFEDEELIPSPQSCTTPGINLEVLSDDALERNNKKFTSLVDNVDVEEELAAAAAAAPATVRKKLCFEIDSSQQQQRQQQLLLRPVKTSKDVEDDNDNIELLPFDSKNTTSSALTTSRSITGTSLKNKEDDQQFVHDSLVVVPDQLITKEVFLPEISTQQQHPDVIVPLVHTTPDTSGTTISIDPAMLIRLEQQWQRRKQEHNMSNNQQGCKHEEEHSSKEKKRKKKKKKEILDRRLLLDAFNEITSRKLPLFLNQDVPWTTIFAQQHQHQEQQQQQQLVVSVQEPAMVRSFVKEVWDELRRIPCAQFDDDVHHTVQTVVRKDIGAKLQQSWSEFNVDVTEVGLELERRIFKELVKEVVAEFLWSQRPTTPTTSSTPTTTTTMSTKTSMTTPTTPTTSSTPTTTMSTKTSMTTPTTPTTTAIRVDVEQ